MLVYLMWTWLIPPISGEGNITWPLSQAVDLPGHIVLGALMMVHEREDLRTCGPIMPQGGIQALECMLYALDRVNEDPRLLPGITIGAYVLDDCDKDTYGLEQAVEFIKGVLDRLRILPIKKMDQRTCIKFCVKNEIKCADAFRMLTVAYGEATLDRSNVYRWYKMFSEGLEDVNDEERAGRPSTSTTDKKLMKWRK
ncbi:GPRMGL5 [Cordylochernes scorpioides]|uniref:GPRMGL5 n=1 Tax=Cordylochernes scorpioides TaxID=51811 RepID=A0ABY6LR95_9ARAC|nr:GPRMGL5 [Cordylochernes scorpioides]